jgi:DNA-binding SARP family transcriptional activator/tetratricopeptide (TPR) repeat protein
MVRSCHGDLKTPGSFRVLGPLTIEVTGRPVSLGFRRQRLILGLLLLESGHLVATDRIIDLAWFGQQPPATARNAVQVCVSRLRTALRATADISTAGSGYRIDVDHGALDLHRFRDLVSAARGQAGADRIALLRAAEQEWRGQVLAGEVGAELRLMLCAGLEEERIAALEDRLAAELELGLHRQVVAELTSLAASHPTRERLACYLMTALYRDGQSAAALEVARRIRAVLSSELGIEPGPALRDVELAVLRQAPRLRPPSPPATRPDVPSQLPPDIFGFVGREQDLAALELILAGQAQQPTAVVIAVVSGGAGVGKTTLAVHWAHRVASRFPDGQLHADLRGFSPGPGPASPAEVLRRFLVALGEPTHGLPPDLDGLAALYRSRTAGKRLLIILDNARDDAQVRPLIPGSAGNTVLVTSRMRLDGLLATAGARPIALDVMSEDEATRLLGHRIGMDRLAPEADAAARILRSCARLPLAVAIVAARIVTSAGLPLAAVAEQLRAGTGSLREFAAADSASDVQGAVSWSYCALSQPAARLFRLLGVHPGPHFTAAAAASIAAAGPAETQVLLEELLRASMLTETAPGRYRMHDLLAAFAAQACHDTDSAVDADAAGMRLVDYYLHASWQATQALYPHRRAIAAVASLPGTIVTKPLAATNALTWLRAEHQVLMQVAQYARQQGLDQAAWLLGWTLRDYLHRQGLWADWLSIEEVTLTAAERSGDAFRRAVAYRGQGRVLAQLGEHEQAHEFLARAISLFGQLSDYSGLAATHQVRADLYGLQGRYGDAICDAGQALGHFQRTGEASQAAATQNNLGFLHLQAGDRDAALQYGRRALAASAEIGDRNLQAAALDTIGHVCQRLGNVPEALANYSKSLALQRALGQRMSEAQTLTSIGDCHQAGGDVRSALPCWRDALDILTSLSHPMAEELSSRIEQAAGTTAAPG